VDLGIEFWVSAARAFLLVAAFTGFSWALLRMRCESAEQLDRVHAAQRELAMHSRVLADRMTALATLVAALPQRSEQRLVEEAPRPAPRREPSPHRSYETAKRLARSGATIDEIVATCGVAGTEARLLLRLHGVEAQRGNAA
jgi:hypothetical protein